MSVSITSGDDKLLATLAAGGPEAQQNIQKYVAAKKAADAAVAELNLGYSAREAMKAAEAKRKEAEDVLAAAREEAAQMVAAAAFEQSDTDKRVAEAKRQSEVILSGAYQVKQDAEAAAQEIVAKAKEAAAAEIKAADDYGKNAKTEVKAKLADLEQKQAELDAALRDAKAAKAAADAAKKAADETEKALQARLAKLKQAMDA